jgi:hypothetical protein
MIPYATTTITVLRVPADPARDPEDPQPEAAAVATGVRAHISTSNGREEIEGASTQEIVAFRLSCDPTEILKDDQVRDDSTGEVYEVAWARERRGLGLDHMEGGLRQVRGSLARPIRAVS